MENVYIQIHRHMHIRMFMYLCTEDCKIIGNRAMVFNDFSSSKLVQNFVENSWVCPKYFAIGSM